MISSETFTVITGASQGLGRSLAVECAKRGRNLLLISLPFEYIYQTANELSREFNIKAIGFESDLTSNEELEKLAQWITSNYEVDMLINNAGIGGSKFFDVASSEYIDDIMQLNMKALVFLTHKLLPILKQQKNSFILNIASAAAFGPMPFKTVYPASKAFVSSFSRGLNAELKGTNVSVSVAYPGGMATNPETTKRMKNYSGLIKSTFLSPETVAKILIKQSLAHKTIIIPGFANKLSRLIFKFVPETWRLDLMSKNLKKEIIIPAA